MKPGSVHAVRKKREIEVKAVTVPIMIGAGLLLSVKK
jgi:hypothetical protein